MSPAPQRIRVAAGRDHPPELLRLVVVSGTGGAADALAGVLEGQPAGDERFARYREREHGDRPGRPPRPVPALPRP